MSFQRSTDKSQIEHAISQLDSSDKNLIIQALDFLLEAKITDYQLLVRVEYKLVELASSSDVAIRQHIWSSCDKICSTNPGLALELTILSESKDDAFLNNIKSNLRFLASNHPIKCLEIIQRWFRTNVLRSGVRLCGILQDIAKGDANKVDNFLRSWIAEEENNVILMFRLPDLLRDMFYWSDKKRLVELLALTVLDDERQLGVVCTTLKMVLCDQRNDPRQFSQDFIDTAFNCVSNLAKSKGIDIAKIEPGDNNTLNRTLAIVDSIENLRRKVDFTVVQQNLKYCTNIRDLLGQQWFDKMITKKGWTGLKLK